MIFVQLLGYHAGDLMRGLEVNQSIYKTFTLRFAKGKVLQSKMVKFETSNFHLFDILLITLANVLKLGRMRVNYLFMIWQFFLLPLDLIELII